MSPNNFSYQKIEANQIRLLAVPKRWLSREPSRSSPLQDLRFDVKTYRRGNTPSYTAVSYAWGNEAPNKRIYLDGRPFPVRPNLWSCLHYLSQSEWEYLWVDAICIDQSNKRERGEQVQVMDEIYRSAVAVSAWLGLVPLPEFYVQDLASAQPLLTLETEPFDWIDALDDLANRPYWSRMWVIQEVLCGSHVEIYCSNNHVDLQYFKWLLERATNNILPSAEAIDKLSRSAISEKYKALPLILGRHPDRHPELQQPLHDLLLNHRRAKCTDARDRVFALLGLIPQRERNLLSMFFPDYFLSHEDVVMITLSYFLEFGRISINEDSGNLFEALGINSQRLAKRLLAAAERFWPWWEVPHTKGAGHPISYQSFSFAEVVEDETALLDSWLSVHDESDIEEVGIRAQPRLESRFWRRIMLLLVVVGFIWLGLQTWRAHLEWTWFTLLQRE